MVVGGVPRVVPTRTMLCMAEPESLDQTLGQAPLDRHMQCKGSQLLQEGLCMGERLSDLAQGTANSPLGLMPGD